MRKLVQLFVFGMCATSAVCAQAVNAATTTQKTALVGVGMDYWATDYSGRFKFGPALWGSEEISRGIGIIAEGHSLLGGALPNYKYVVGEGGLIYSLHRWNRVTPFAKAEVGFGSLTVPRFSTFPTHYTRTTYAIGAGAERRLTDALFLRIDYTYNWFPDFVSPVTNKAHSLNPNGLTLGVSYHFHLFGE